MSRLCLLRRIATVGSPGVGQPSSVELVEGTECTWLAGFPGPVAVVQLDDGTVCVVPANAVERVEEQPASFPAWTRLLEPIS